MKNISSHAHKAGWYLFWVLFKISDEHPRPFHMGVPSRELLVLAIIFSVMHKPASQFWSMNSIILEWKKFSYQKKKWLLIPGAVILNFLELYYTPPTSTSAESLRASRPSTLLNTDLVSQARSQDFLRVGAISWLYGPTSARGALY